MQSRDRTAAIGLFVLVLFFWLGFLVHRAPRFAGSAWGGFFGVTATAFMLVPLAYTLAKRFGNRRGMSTLLQAHVFFGLAGALLALVHTGHAFRSALGIALTTSSLLTVLSGFIGQYYLRYVAENEREKETELSVLWREIEVKSRALARSALEPSGSMQAVAELVPLVTATAELQYSMQFQSRVRRLSRAWRAVHIVCAIAFYLLLTLHIWSGIHFGLRWFE